MKSKERKLEFKDYSYSSIEDVLTMTSSNTVVKISGHIYEIEDPSIEEKPEL